MSNVVYVYCKHCGFMPDWFSATGAKCHYCNHTLVEYRSEYTREEYLSWDGEKKIQIKNEIFELIVKKNPEFRQEALEAREIQSKKEIRETCKRSARTIWVSCPYCHGRHTRKITSGNIVSNAFFGIFSKNIGKQWHCDDCGSDF